MINKALLVSTLALSSFLLTSTSFAIDPTNVRCPSKRLIQEAVDKVELKIQKVTKWKEYIVTSPMQAFESDGHHWSFSTVVHGNNTEEAMANGKKGLQHIDGKFNDFAEKKDGPFVICMYFSKHGIIFAGTNLNEK